jgi:hypothetical protein
VCPYLRIFMIFVFSRIFNFHIYSCHVSAYTKFLPRPALHVRAHKETKERLLNYKNTFKFFQSEKLKFGNPESELAFVSHVTVYFLFDRVYPRKGLKSFHFYGLCSSFVSAAPYTYTVLLHFVMCIILSKFSYTLFYQNPTSFIFKISFTVCTC